MHPIGVAYAWPLYENMSSSTKPELHSILQRRSRKTELQQLRQHAKKTDEVWLCDYREMFADIAYIQTYRVIDTREQTDGQTDRQTYYTFITILQPCRSEIIIIRASYGDCYSNVDLTSEPCTNRRSWWIIKVGFFCVYVL